MKEDWTKKAIDELKKAEITNNKFLEHKYDTLSKEDKINYWVNLIKRQFRWNEESGIDGYLSLSEKDYCLWKKVEPNLYEFLPTIAKQANLSIQKIKEAFSIK
jgi:hypothetical protein